MNLGTLLILAPPILFALAFHEYSHGWVANRLGDPTAKNAGRLTLNPLSHLDPIGTIMLFIVHFGWAKPVPVNPVNLQDPKRDMLWVSLAGPGSNMLLALAFGLVVRLLGMSGFGALSAGIPQAIQLMLVYGVIINLALAAFNLIPIPPLDGSKILHAVLPYEYEQQYAQFEQYGPILLVGLVMIGMFGNFSIFGAVLRPFISFFSQMFAGVDLAAGF
ncbi:MAG TPA: site-2 protease family protein [bacterium]|nr:site-2 protease family protein [bacterium]